MKYKIIYLLCLLISLSAVANEKKELLPKGYFADNGFGAPVGGAQMPDIFTFKNKSYIVYQGTAENPYICTYDITTNKWEGPILVGISDLGKIGEEKKIVDNHGKPAVIVDDDGFIHVFYGGHGGGEISGNELGGDGRGQRRHAVSCKPMNISKFEELDDLSKWGTYDKVVKMDNGDIYIFYRHGAHKSTWVYQKRPRTAKRFNEPIPILLHGKNRNRPEFCNAWYLSIQKATRNRIIIAYALHYCAYDSTKHSADRRNAYFMYMDTTTDKFYNDQDKELAMPLSEDLADKLTKVVDTGEQYCMSSRPFYSPSDDTIYITYRFVGKDSKSDRLFASLKDKKWTKGGTISVPSGTNPNDTAELMYIDGAKMMAVNSVSDGKKGGKIVFYSSSDYGKSWEIVDEFMEQEKYVFTIGQYNPFAATETRMIICANKKINNKKMIQRYQFLRDIKLYMWGDNGLLLREDTSKE